MAITVDKMIENLTNMKKQGHGKVVIAIPDGFGYSDIREGNLARMSNGEQRLVLTPTPLKREVILPPGGSA